MKLIVAVCTLLLITVRVNAQRTTNYKTIDSIALAIPAPSTQNTSGIAKYINTHFTKDDEKIRAAFIWIASTLKYDVPNINKQTPGETAQDKIGKALANHKGVCEHYALLFDDICNQLGITSFIIQGYTRKYGQASLLAHAWCCAQVNGTWWLYDPTWAAGYVQNGQFIPRINEAFYKVPPQTMIATHMPFDKMWQLLPYPITNKEFIDSVAVADNKRPIFYFEDSIKNWKQQTEEQRLIDAGRRIEENGANTTLVQNELKRVKMGLAFINSNKFNASVAEFNKAVKSLNDFIIYRNKQFTPLKPDQTIQNMLDTADKQLKLAATYLSDIKTVGSIDDSKLSNYKKQVSDLIVKLESQKTFLNNYIIKDTQGRKAMFEE